jgi:SAM-dependent methyltransferase
LLLKAGNAFVYLADVHYDGLLDTSKTYHRDQIYGSGQPNAAVHPESMALARALPGPLLDFGCGSGALVKELRTSGIEAYGIELDNFVIRGALQPEAAAYVTLYGGEFPTPYAEGQFRSVFCSEVLEHIPQFELAVAEIARLTSERAVFTVPDAAAIPLGFRHGLVPWHLLEGTHVNFFSQRSLGTVLQPHFREITFGRVGPSHINETSYHVSLVAWCNK